MPTFSGIPKLETNFATNLRGTGGIYFNQVPAIYSGATGLRPKKGKSGSQYESYYYQQEKTKKKIILHETVGFLTGDMSAVTKEDVHMSVQYVIARNGTVYELFDPKYWSYHLGRNAVGGNGYGSKESIGIELSNIGPLTLNGTNLNNVYGSKYCSITDVTEFTRIEGGFRGYEYFATFTNAQYAALQGLLTFLTSTYGIPYQFLPESKRVNVFKTAAEARAFEGICSHVNFRATGKYDLGPDFQWDRITSDSEPIVVDPDKEFIFEDDEPATNPFDPNYGEVPKTAAEKAKASNNSNSSHYCTISLSDQLDETYEGGTLGGLITDKLDNIEWSEIDMTDSDAMRKAATDAIAESMYEFITSADELGEPLHYSLTATTTGTHLLPPPATPAQVPLVQLALADIQWPSLDSLKNTLNKYYTGIQDLFSAFFQDWLGQITVTPLSDDPQVYFLGAPGVPGAWLTGDFGFEWNSALVTTQALACEAELQLKQPAKIIETWTIIQTHLFNALSLAIAGEQNGTGVYTPGPSLGSAAGGGASVGYCLGVPSNTYTPIASTCTLTFTNPDF
jgi:N-acetyl-anhydromuramyl-L-alanine amidase AmpD